MTKVMKCDCKHADQDRIHRQGRRVFNKTLKGKAAGATIWRCTVCGSEK